MDLHNCSKVNRFKISQQL